MALVACPECGAEVSDAAPACVRCGRPLAGGPAGEPRRVITSEDSFATRSRGCADLLIFGGLALGILLLVFLIAGRGCVG